MLLRWDVIREGAGAVVGMDVVSRLYEKHSQALLVRCIIGDACQNCE